MSKDGEGLKKVWQKHFQQLRNVSADMAAAITNVYPSPQSLLQVMRRIFLFVCLFVFTVFRTLFFKFIRWIIYVREYLYRSTSRILISQRCCDLQFALLVMNLCY